MSGTMYRHVEPHRRLAEPCVEGEHEFVRSESDEDEKAAELEVGDCDRCLWCGWYRGDVSAKLYGVADGR